MRIAMFTNTYLPHVGGVARSVQTYEAEFRRRGHDVRIIAPEFEGAEESTSEVLRVPAVQKFNGSDFSVRLPLPGLIADFLDEFQPDLVHSHHPFLLGDSALRSAWERHLPLVFTHHTLYEQYTHYVPLNSTALKRVAIEMATQYCNLCSHVIAPSESILKLLKDRGVTAPVTPIPTGIDLDFFGSGDGNRFRSQFDIEPGALVVGHLGRLAAEKNLDYLATALGEFLASHPQAVAVVIGDGDHRESMQKQLAQHAEPRQIVFAGKQSGQTLADAYAAMQLFAFSSQSETQGMVLAEAMAAGVPVVALDGPGVREMVNATNGRLLAGDAPAAEFCQALEDFACDRKRLASAGQAARRSAQDYGLGVCADRMLALYEQLIEEFANGPSEEFGPWDSVLARLEIEWKLVVEKTAALAAAVVETDAGGKELV
jgi:glycosyltransferase involved in cell wall biosynthesis